MFIVGLYVWEKAGGDQSLLAFGLDLLSSPDTAQVVIDLYILAVLACVWMYQDAKKCGKGLGYIMLIFARTAVFVSARPLLYLVLRSEGGLISGLIIHLMCCKMCGGYQALVSNRAI